MLCGFSAWCPLTETDHIWGFWASYGECVGVNVKGERRERRHISNALRRVLSSSVFDALQNKIRDYAVLHPAKIIFCVICFLAFISWPYHIMHINEINEILYSLNICKSLTHWGWVTHICVSKLTIIGVDNGLLPGPRQAIICTKAGISLIGFLGTNFIVILIVIQKVSFNKMHLKMTSAKWRPFCLGLNVLTYSPAFHPMLLVQLQFDLIPKESQFAPD